MIRTLYFICIIFVKKYNYILADTNSESSWVIFSLFCLHPVGQTFLYPSSKFCNHLKLKYLYTTYMFWFVKTCTLILSRTRKQNWINICQCCLRIWRAGRGWGLEVFKCFVRIFSTCFVYGDVSGSVSLLPRKK